MNVNWSPAARPGRPAWVEVELGAIAANAATLRGIAGNAELLAVVKADGYGHGLEGTARAALAGGATWLGLGMLAEAVYLRERLAVAAGAEAGADGAWAQAWPDAKLLVLGYTPRRQADAAVASGARLACDSIELATALAAAARAQGKRAYVHVKVETGMGRTGLPPADVPAFLRRLSTLDGLVVEGLFTHLADAENAFGHYTEGQLKTLADLQMELERRQLSPPIWHAANTAAALHRGGETRQLIRAGIALYGYQPSPDMTAVPLQRALAWKAELALAKRVAPGTPVGYGCTYRAEAETWVGTVPLGYGDGFSRHWSNTGTVLCRGQRVPVIGRVCMDQFMVSLQPVADGAPLAAGEEIVLLGRQGDKEISADDLATGLGTISYEVLCLIGRRIPRLYTWGGVPVGCRDMV